MPITSKFVCLNGRFLKEEELSFNATNRAFRYGDGFFETMHYANGKIQLFELHQQRMKRAMNLLKLESKILLIPNLIHKEIVHLINANHFFKGARVRVSIFRSGGGLYTPESNRADYLIESWALDSDNYPLNKKGLSIETYSILKKAKDSNSFYKSLNTRVSILASLYKQEINVDDCLIYNTDGDIIETISSNIFFIKNKTVYTSSKDSGCVNGIMRAKLIEIIPKVGLQIIEDTHIKASQLNEFDEIFLTNAIQGLQWIGAYKTKRYDNKHSKSLQKQLINEIFKQ
jgi:branched-chain amino acid aminotransferase